MLGRSHGLSGVVVWLAGCAAVSAAGVAVEPVTAVAGALVCAGAALLPDADHPNSTVARAGGTPTWMLALAVSRLSDWVRDRTCGCCATTTAGGHRTLTHTALFAVLAGTAVAGLGAWAGKLAGLVIVAVVAGLGAYAMLRRRRAQRAAAVGLLAALAVAGMPGGGSWWWIGLAVGGGCLVHALGDAATLSAVPLWWPLRIRGCRWYRCGSPRWLRFRTGGAVEVWLVVPGLVLAGAGSVWALV